MGPDAFHALVDEAVEALPGWVQDALASVAIVVADTDPDDPDLYGLYDGDGPHGPGRVTIYRVPITSDCDSLAEVREEVRITLLHEIAHHFGIDEDRLDELGYG